MRLSNRARDRPKQSAFVLECMTPTECHHLYVVARNHVLYVYVLLHRATVRVLTHYARLKQVGQLVGVESGIIIDCQIAKSMSINGRASWVEVHGMCLWIGYGELFLQYVSCPWFSE